MSSFARRAAITIAVPAVLLALRHYVPLPGVPLELFDLAQQSGGAPTNIGVFSLGVVPAITAYVLVEVMAFLVPRWSRMRHAGPTGRAPLERAARPNGGRRGRGGGRARQPPRVLAGGQRSGHAVP